MCFLFEHKWILLDEMKGSFGSYEWIFRDHMTEHARSEPHGAYVMTDTQSVSGHYVSCVIQIMHMSIDYNCIPLSFMFIPV